MSGIAKRQIRERIEQLKAELKALETTVAQYQAAIGELERLIAPDAAKAAEYIEAAEEHAST